MLALNSGHTVCDVASPLLARDTGVKILLQQIFRHRQTVLTVADQAELPGRFCAKPLTPQAGGNGFDVVRRMLICKSWNTITLFCIRESLTNRRIAVQTELLSPV